MDFPNPNYIRQLPSDIAGTKHDCREKTWSVCNAHRREPCFLQRKIKLAGKRAQNNIKNNKYRNFSDIKHRFHQILCEKTVNFLQGQNRACSKMAPRREKEDACAREVT